MKDNEDIAPARWLGASLVVIVLIGVIAVWAGLGFLARTCRVHVPTEPRMVRVALPITIGDSSPEPQPQFSIFHIAELLRGQSIMAGNPYMLSRLLGEQHQSSFRGSFCSCLRWTYRLFLREVNIRLVFPSQRWCPPTVKKVELDSRITSDSKTDGLDATDPNPRPLAQSQGVSGNPIGLLHCTHLAIGSSDIIKQHN